MKKERVHILIAAGETIGFCPSMELLVRCWN